jgi:hypothetical protein
VKLVYTQVYTQLQGDKNEEIFSFTFYFSVCFLCGIEPYFLSVNTSAPAPGSASSSAPPSSSASSGRA